MTSVAKNAEQNQELIPFGQIQIKREEEETGEKVILELEQEEKYFIDLYEYKWDLLKTDSEIDLDHIQDVPWPLAFEPSDMEDSQTSVILSFTLSALATKARLRKSKSRLRC